MRRLRRGAAERSVRIAGGTGHRVDLCEGQLRGDRTTAAHYGYEVATVKGDACDLSCFADASSISSTRPPDRDGYRTCGRSIAACTESFARAGDTGW